MIPHHKYTYILLNTCRDVDIKNDLFNISTNPYQIGEKLQSYPSFYIFWCSSIEVREKRTKTKYQFKIPKFTYFFGVSKNWEKVVFLKKDLLLSWPMRIKASNDLGVRHIVGKRKDGALIWCFNRLVLRTKKQQFGTTRK